MNRNAEPQIWCKQKIHLQKASGNVFGTLVALETDFIIENAERLATQSETGRDIWQIDMSLETVRKAEIANSATRDQITHYCIHYTVVLVMKTLSEVCQL